jgi:polysaccharide export outer membrane protein
MQEAVVAHDQELNSKTTENARIAAAIRRFLQAICLAVLLLPAALSAETVDSHPYRLAPGDRITVTVFGQPELSVDALVDDAGAITIPLAEPIEVKDLTLLECQKRIGDRLADGILRKPSISVRIAELRPLSVLGDVRLPGAYPFRYGSTVQSAVALAGGFGPGELQRNTAVSEFLLAEEHLRQLTLQKRTMLVRKARLEAQRDGQDTFSPPDFSDADDDKDTIKIVADERDIFATQGAILRDQIDLLRSEKPHLQEQIEANTEQGSAGKKQLDLIRQQIDRYEKLFKQGLGTQNNDFQYRVLEANQEAAVWRLLSDVSRLQMQSGELDVKIQEVEAAFKRQVATELQQTRDRLNELEVTLPAAVRIRDVKFRYAGGAAGQRGKYLISITRTQNGHAVILDANETTQVEPGDVIDVKSDMPRVLPHDEAAAVPRTSQSYKAQETDAGETISPISR